MTPYIQYNNIIIATNPINPARNAPFNALSPSDGLIFSSCIRINGAGNVPSFNESESFLADSVVNDPLISAVHPQILLWMFGAVSKFPPTKIAIGLPIFACVILQNISFPFSSKLMTTTGSPISEALELANLKYAPLRIVCPSVAGIRVSLSCTNTSSNIYMVQTFPDISLPCCLSNTRNIVYPSNFIPVPCVSALSVC